MRSGPNRQSVVSGTHIYIYILREIAIYTRMMMENGDIRNGAKRADESIFNLNSFFNSDWCLKENA